MMAATGRIAAGRALGEAVVASKASVIAIPAAMQSRMLTASSRDPAITSSSASSSSSTAFRPNNTNYSSSTSSRANTTFVSSNNACSMLPSVFGPSMLPSTLFHSQPAATQRRYRSNIAPRGGRNAPGEYRPPREMGEYQGNKGRVATPLAEDETQQWRKEGVAGEFMHEQVGRLHTWDFRMGAYASKMKINPKTGKMYPKGTYIVAPKKDPVTWVLCGMMTCILVWNIAQLSWGETYGDRRRFMVSERIRKEFGLPPGWDEDVLEDGDDEWMDRLDWEEEMPRKKLT